MYAYFFTESSAAFTEWLALFAVVKGCNSCIIGIKMSCQMKSFDVVLNMCNILKPLVFLEGHQGGFFRHYSV